MINRILSYIREHHMIDAGDCVVAGVSGGADSVCLFMALLEIRNVIPIDIRVVHVNHLIRDDAAEDALYVKKLCLENDIPFTLVERDVVSLARERRISTEETGRDVRYDAFYRELGQRRGKIAVAHNKNDCCETLLFNLFRGSSLRGLAGISPVRDVIIRPLLCLERKDIEAFLHERGIAYRIDSTNLEDNYSRNIIRHHILGTAVKDISPAAVAHIGSACERVREAYALIEDITADAYRACAKMSEDGSVVIDREKLAALRDTVQRYVIVEALSEAAGSRRDLGTVHIGQVRGLMDKQCGREIELPHGLRARRDYAGVCIYRGGAGDEDEAAFGGVAFSERENERLLSGETVELSLGAYGKISAVLVPKNDFSVNLQNIPQKKYTKWIDYDRIENGIAIRTRREGDYLTIDDRHRRKSLKSYFIDNKIPRGERGRTILVADGSHVVWLTGWRISSYYKVGNDTKRILRLNYIKDTKEE